MVHPISALSSTALDHVREAKATSKPNDGFLNTLNQALDQVSSAQKASGTADRALITGAPGASLENAVAADARAKVDWNAVVAVRNEVVNAYNTVMNMPV